MIFPLVIAFIIGLVLGYAIRRRPRTPNQAAAWLAEDLAQMGLDPTVELRHEPKERDPDNGFRAYAPGDTFVLSATFRRPTAPSRPRYPRARPRDPGAGS